MIIKIGIVGFNEIAKRHYSEIRRSNKFEISTIYDENESGMFGRAEIINDFKKFIQTNPDAILICVNSNELINAVSTCIKHTKHIIIGTMLPKNTSDLRELRYIADTHKATLTPCICDRFNPVIDSLNKSLSKEDEIYSCDIFHQIPKLGDDILTKISVCDISVMRYLFGETTHDFIAYFTNITNQTSSDNVNILYKTKNHVLINISNSLCGDTSQYLIRVNAKSGVYFADIINQKLHQINENGQINLKVNNKDTQLQVMYDKFYDYFSGNNNELVKFDEIINIKELFEK